MDRPGGESGVLGGLVALLVAFAFLPLPTNALHVLYLVTAVATIAAGFRGVAVHRPLGVALFALLVLAGPPRVRHAGCNSVSVASQ